MPTETARLLRKLDQRGTRPIVVASHPRSGTHLCIDAVRLNFPESRSWKLPLERADRLYVNLDTLGDLHCFNPRDIDRVMKRTARPLVKTHSLPGLWTVPSFFGRSPVALDPELADWLSMRASFLYAYRDGRDALHSLYQMMQAKPGAALPSISEFLRQQLEGMSRVRMWAMHVQAWMGHPHAHCVAMDRLMSHPAQELATIARTAGLSADGGEARLPSPCGTSLSSRLARRVLPLPRSTSIEIAGRGGTWSESFSPADREFFHREAGDLLIQLGYEKSDRWVAEANPRRAASHARANRSAAPRTPVRSGLLPL